MGNSMFLGRGPFETKDVVTEIVILPKVVAEIFLFFRITIPRDPITLSEDDWGVQSPPQEGI